MKRKKGNKNKISGFREGLKYIGESRIEIYAIIILFFAMALICFLNPEKFIFLDGLIRDILNKTQDLKGASLIGFIFLNNLKSSFWGMALGIFAGIFPVWNAIINGGILGYVFARVYEVSGAWEFWRIVPHGVFELPAIFISLGLGVKLGEFVFYGKGWKEKWKEMKRRILGSLNVFFYIVLPLLAIAAIIEGTLINLLS